MNTNSNVYTVIYTTIIVVIVAAVLAFVAMTLKPKQDANIKAETISQMLAAAQYASKEDLSALGNDAVLSKYSQNIKSAFIVNAAGEKVSELNTDVKSIELATDFKVQNKNIKNGSEVALPVYLFDKDGADVYVIPVYGAGLWGPIWGYFAINNDCSAFIGAYFDHESETPGLGSKIKDESSFREQFVGKIADFTAEKVFAIVKGGAPEEQKNAVDAISGATMTCNGLDAAINTWFLAYKPFFEKIVCGAANSFVDTASEACKDGCSNSCSECKHETCVKSEEK